jgi:hypothetical protein
LEPFESQKGGENVDTQISPTDSQQTEARISRLWWTLPVFLGLLGGAIAYYAVRGRDAERARGMLIAGAFITVFAVLRAL